MIKITDRFYINASSTCYTLQEKTSVKDVKSENYGKEVTRDIGYYSTIEECLKGFLKAITREFIGQEQENSLKELLEQVKIQNNFIKSLKLDI